MSIGTPRAGALTRAGTSSSTATVSYPSGVTAGELLVIAIGARANPGTEFTADGWTAIRAQGASYARFAFLYRVATAAHTGSVTVSGPAVLRSLKMLAVPGVDPATPIDQAPTMFQGDGSVADPVTVMASQTPSVPGCMPLWGASGFQGPGATWTPTPSSGVTEWLDTWQESSTSSTEGRSACAYWQIPLADTSPTGERRATPTVAATSAGVFLLLRPAPEPQPPTASFTLADTWLTVDVDASGSTDPDGSITSYEWNFGDGGTATGAVASHTYASAGSYDITLTVTDDQGLTDQAVQTIAVEAEPPPEPSGPNVISGGLELSPTWSAIVGGVEVPVVSWSIIQNGVEVPLNEATAPGPTAGGFGTQPYGTSPFGGTA